MLLDDPSLILMDELLNFVSRGRKLGMRDQLFDFLQNLPEEARARDGVVLCVSIPKSLTCLTSVCLPHTDSRRRRDQTFTP